MVKKKITIEEVKHVAMLANLLITDDEAEKYSESLSSIVDLVSKLQSFPTSSVPPTSQVTGQVNVFREDKIENDRILTQEEALSNAKKTHNGYFVVPKIFE